MKKFLSAIFVFIGPKSIRTKCFYSLCKNVRFCKLLFYKRWIVLFRKLQTICSICFLFLRLYTFWIIAWKQINNFNFYVSVNFICCCAASIERLDNAVGQLVEEVRASW